MDSGSGVVGVGEGEGPGRGCGLLWKVRLGREFAELGGGVGTGCIGWLGWWMRELGHGERGSLGLGGVGGAWVCVGRRWRVGA